MDKNELMDEINTFEGRGSKYTLVWHSLGRFLYTPLAIVICVVALAFKVAF